MENKRIIIGYDLSEFSSRISMLSEEMEEPKALYYGNDPEKTKFPLALFKKNDQIWLWGYEAVDAKDKYEGIFIDHFIDNYDIEKELIINNQTFLKKELLLKYIELSINYFKKNLPDFEMDYLSISLGKMTKTLINDLKMCATHLGLSPIQLYIENHAVSFQNYVMSQKKEFWSHDVGLFEYDEKGMYYHHLAIAHTKSPIVVQTAKVALNMYMSAKMYKEQNTVDLDGKFTEIIKQVFAQRVISTVFITGDGFKGQWMKLSLRYMKGAGRKIYSEDNIFASGACYSSRLMISSNNHKSFIALNDDIIPYDVSVQGKLNRKLVQIKLFEAGQFWYKASNHVRCLLDHTDTITLFVRNTLKKQEKMIPIRLEGIEKKVDKTTVVDVSIAYEDASVCYVTIKDLGFGELFPTSGKVWRQRVNIDAYENNSTQNQNGRLLFVDPDKNKVPYIFKLTKTKVYSLEEFVHFIYNNVYIIEKSLFDDELIQWFEKNIKEPGLARTIQSLNNAKAPLKSFVMQTIAYSDYYETDELNQLLKYIDVIERQDPLIYRKNQADQLLKYNRYFDAINAYKSITVQMEQIERKSITRMFKGSVYHNLACANMQILNYDSAIACFKRAYQLNNDLYSLKCCLWAAKMNTDEVTFFELVEHYKLNEQFIEMILKEYDQAWAKIPDEEMVTKEEAFKEFEKLKAFYRG